MEEEIWKGIPGYPMYQVSSKGRVRSNASKRTPGKILKNVKNGKGYWVVKLARGNSRGNNGYDLKQVHRLVAEAFIEVPAELKDVSLSELVVDHVTPVSEGGDILNEDGTFNLRWTTTFGNVHNPRTVKNVKEAMEKRKQKVYVYDEDLHQVSAFTSTLEAALETGKSQGNIASCCQGALRRYLSRIWSYVPITDIKEREKLEESMAYQREKNQANTYKAMRKYYTSEKGRKAVREYYLRNAEKMKARSKAWYWSHRNEVLERYRAENDRKGEEGRGS
jgi:hypothetical protein